MVLDNRIDPQRVIGRAPERLTIKEAQTLAGKFVALEVYSPETTPLRRIEAIGETPEECVSQLAARGLDPHRFEFVMLKAPY